MRNILIFLLVLDIILFVELKENSNSSQAEDRLKIVSSTVVLGPIDSTNNTSIQAFNYDFVLYSEENEEIHLDSVEPIFTKDLLTRVITENHEIIGNKTISPNSTISVKGQVEFNASGLSKEQILNLDPIYSVNVTSTKTLLFHKGES
ncbi:hypothetical protein MSBR3_0859 [Methanosarcina barkeri 3]|uniref:Uncharacterized protein n=2 Tax=Methanosarcina barkeri TaxID=2208 RepID=A0A0E3SKH4_METBA|nr:hypothetical protein MSBR3_0859 [Methanosarcina barkeri 3]